MSLVVRRRSLVDCKGPHVLRLWVCVSSEAWRGRELDGEAGRRIRGGVGGVCKFSGLSKWSHAGMLSFTVLHWRSLVNRRVC